MHALPSSLLMLAQADYSGAATWISIAIAFGALVVCLVQVFRPSPAHDDKFARRDDVASIQAEVHALLRDLEKYARRDDHLGLAEKFDALLTQNTEHYTGILKAGGERAGKLHARIDQLSTRLSELSETVAEMRGKKTPRGVNHGTS